MMAITKCQKGFINPLIILAVLVLVGVAGYYATSLKTIGREEPEQEASRYEGDEPPEAQPVQRENKTKPPAGAINAGTTGMAPSGPRVTTQSDRVGLFGQQCEGAGDFKLKTFPLEAKYIEFIRPMGRVQDSHVTPTNHQYIVPIGTESGSLVTNNPKKYEIKAPVDGYIINIELFREPIEEQYRDQAYRDNYLVVFEHSCDFYTRLIHIDTLSEKVLSSFSFKNPESQHPYASARIAVKEGEVIGTVGSHSFDFQIINANVKNPRIINPQQLEDISVYTVDTFDYLLEPLRGALLNKNLIKKEPLGGTIGYDIQGKLAGNWFKAGRNKNKGDYWTDELSVVYDHLDPTQIRISLGNFGGYPKAFGVRGNAPDPAVVGESSGIVKYELVKFDYYSGANIWDALHFADDLVAKNTDELAGVALFQLFPDGKLKMETFPGKTASQVVGFTSSAITYER